jgi:hypothetical protein
MPKVECPFLRQYQIANNLPTKDGLCSMYGADRNTCLSGRCDPMKKKIQDNNKDSTTLKK